MQINVSVTTSFCKHSTAFSSYKTIFGVYTIVGCVIYHYNGKYTIHQEYTDMHPPNFFSCKICQHLSTDASHTRGCA